MLYYSEMQSDGNRFWGDIVLDSFDMAYRIKDSILDIDIDIDWYLNNEYFEF